MSVIAPIDYRAHIVVAAPGKIVDINNDTYGLVVSDISMAFSESYAVTTTMDGSPAVIFGTETRPASITMAVHPIKKDMELWWYTYDGVISYTMSIEKPDGNASEVLSILFKLDTASQSRSGALFDYAPAQLNGMLLFAGYISQKEAKEIYDGSTRAINTARQIPNTVLPVLWSVADGVDISQYFITSSVAATVSQVNQVIVTNKWNGVKRYATAPTMVSLAATVPLLFVPQILQWYESARLSKNSSVLYRFTDDRTGVLNAAYHEAYPVALTISISSNNDTAAISLGLLTEYGKMIGTKGARSASHN